MDDELTALLVSLGPTMQEYRAEPVWADLSVHDGESDSAWRGRVRRLRARHDATALEMHRRLGWRPVAVPSMASIDYVEIGVGDEEIDARCYRPATSGPLPAIVFLHGGAFWMGGGAACFELSDILCRTLADSVPAVVLNIDYRLGPEHRYPAPIDDVCAVLDWLRDHHDRLGIDPDRVGLMGVSSGAHVAASASLWLRDHNRPVPRAQFLVTPLVEIPVVTGGPVGRLPAEALAHVACAYLPPAADWEAERDYLSPADAADLTLLPATHLALARHDELVPGAERFADRLRAAGVTCSVSWHEMTHTIATQEVFSELGADLCTAARGLLA